MTTSFSPSPTTNGNIDDDFDILSSRTSPSKTQGTGQPIDAFDPLAGIYLSLHGPLILVDKTNFDLVLNNHADFYRFEETSSYWSVKRISVFLCFSLVNHTLPASQ